MFARAEGRFRESVHLLDTWVPTSTDRALRSYILGPSPGCQTPALRTAGRGYGHTLSINPRNWGNVLGSNQSPPLYWRRFFWTLLGLRQSPCWPKGPQGPV